MSYREVSVIEVKEILRLWLDGRSLRAVSALAGVDRKTVRRYVEAAQAAGLDREDELSDELLGAVVGAVRPDRPHGVGAAREALGPNREQIAERLKKDLTLTKVHVLLGRRGVVVPYWTLHRYAVTELGFGATQARPAVRGRSTTAQKAAKP
jgi:transposase